jgi:formylglycine-generating enzyme required for sulfatase activity/dienelactone hydrolase
MGEVYRARDPKLGRDVAIKVLPPGLRADEAAHARFEREARAIAALTHPHIVTIHEIAQTGGLDFIVMEFVGGRSLKAIIAGGPLPMAQAIDYAQQIAGALEAAHAAGIVHRDIKPANILVSDAGQVKVLDFGLAKLSADAGPDAMTETAPVATQAGAVIGTVAYMSPEQAMGQPVDVRSDIFSFGAVLYEMITGRRAFPGDTTVTTLANILAHDPPPLASVRPDVRAELARLIARCLQRDRTARPTSQDVARQLSEMVRGASRTRRPMRTALVAAGVLAVAVPVGWLLKRNADARWVATTGIPEVRALAGNRQFFQAFLRAREIAPYAAGNAEFASLWNEIAAPRSLTTDPPGAELAIAAYNPEAPAWIVVGLTPLTNVAIPRGSFQMRISKPGYLSTEDLVAGPAAWRTAITLIPEPSGAAGMVRADGPDVPQPFYLGSGAEQVELRFPDFWIDRYEVTNREYKAFVDAGGYTRAEFWIHPIVKDGRELAWKDAMPLFRDATGRPGPATWQAGTFPDGQEDWPVTGVSWYEADAFLRFAGKALPTLAHWQRASGLVMTAQILQRANFRGRGPLPVGRSKAVNRFGAHDFAGNVKEWIANAAGPDLRYILGGAWDEPAYMFTETDARSPLERSANFGIRGARYDDGDRSAEELGGLIPKAFRDYAKEVPAADAVFAAYRRFFSYDRTPVTAVMKATRDAAEWRIETVAFPAAYGGETVLVHVFLPKSAPPPWQGVLFLMGSSQFGLRSSQDQLESPSFAHVLRSGRAVAMPIVKGAFERGTEQFTSATSRETELWRDYTVAIVKDLARTLDYLDTRSDVVHDRVGYLGVSRGAALAPLILSLEPTRLKTAVLMIPGLWLVRPAAEVDVFNYLPRVTQPTLMLSGHYDFIFPEQSSQLPFFQALGTPPDRKRRVAYDTGHNLPPAEMIKETLDWLDATLGPVGR